MKLHEVIDIPREIHRGRFVLKLTEGVERPAETVGEYVVTDQLASAFGRALSLIHESVASGKSRAAYLHGSFGSGKSHFMAVLHLLLRGEATALSIPRLRPVLAEHRWLGSTKFLLVPFHMVGAKSLEQAIFQGYIDHVGRLHPEAPPPAVYRSEALFENAVKLRDSLGEAAFLRTLGGAAADEDDLDWGGLPSEDAWTAARFEAALVKPPLHPERKALLQALVRSHFPAFASYAMGEEAALLDIDRGLAVLSDHAQALGYDALVFFLDEVILWLAGHASNPDFVSREGQKLAKLVESQVAARSLPLVAFLARQKPLKELVGEDLDGIERSRLDASMAWNDGRFAEITLEDRNLPVIAHERLLKPRNEAAAALLAESFERALRVRRDVLDALTTDEGDRELFRLVYPFSPALVQTLVALSAALQRERSALRMLLQLLVDQRETLTLGRVVPIGDLWDALTQGTEAVSAEMAARFQAARRLWQDKLLPVLREQHGLSGDAPLSEVAQNEGRWMKTLLLAALVPEVEALRNLTVQRLAALNHGTVLTPIPGQEAATVEAAINRWVARGVTEVRRTGP
ncbi:MAG: hypothetical protein KC549_18270, partial [Myxococcales bacterium]|nr:hypothetical protein [Myxococcales bacterium]